MSFNSSTLFPKAMTSPKRPLLKDPKSTAILTLDFQTVILRLAQSPPHILDRAAQAIQAARRIGAKVIHVGIAFSDGYPELDAIVEGTGEDARAKDGRKEWELL